MAASRALNFCLDWFMHPLIYGDYPPIMRDLVKERLPKFTKEEAILIIDSFDFLGVNYYTAKYAKDNSNEVIPKPSYLTDFCATLTSERDGIPIGPKADASSWLAAYPQGLEDVLRYIKNYYKNPIIYVTENGCLDYDSPQMYELINDKDRIKYYHDHLYNLNESIKAEGDIPNFLVSHSLISRTIWKESLKTQQNGSTISS